MIGLKLGTWRLRPSAGELIEWGKSELTPISGENTPENFCWMRVLDCPADGTIVRMAAYLGDGNGERLLGLYILNEDGTAVIGYCQPAVIQGDPAGWQFFDATPTFTVQAGQAYRMAANGDAPSGDPDLYYSEYDVNIVANRKSDSDNSPTISGWVPTPNSNTVVPMNSNQCPMIYAEIQT